MGLLGDFLESFYGQGPSFQSVRARVRRQITQVEKGESSRRKPIGRIKSQVEEPKTITIDSTFWAILPDHVRVDETHSRNGHPDTTTEITTSEKRFKRTSDGNVEVEEDRNPKRRERHSLPTDYCRHFDSGLIREFFASLILEQIGECSVAGRDCVRFRATPIQSDSLWPHWLPAEADEFEFAADLVYSSLLSITSLLSGVTIESVEVVEVAYNVRIEKSMFFCKPSDGGKVRKAIPVTQPISLEDAISKMPFKILLPTIKDFQTTPGIYYEPARNSKSPEQVTIFYHHRADQDKFWFHLSAHSDLDLEKRLVWEEIVFRGQHFMLSDPETEGGMSILKFCQEETWVKIISDLSRNDLLEVAKSFRPAGS